MMTEPPRWRRAVAALLLLAFTACHTWHPTTASPRSLIEDEDPSALRVTQANGLAVTVKDPMIRNDSLVSGTSGVTGPVGVPTGDIQSVEVRRFDKGKTVGFVIGLIAAAVAWTTAVTGDSSGGTGDGPGPLPKDPG